MASVFVPVMAATVALKSRCHDLVSTVSGTNWTPIARHQFKEARPRHARLHPAFAACLFDLRARLAHYLAPLLAVAADLGGHLLRGAGHKLAALTRDDVLYFGGIERPGEVGVELGDDRRRPAGRRHDAKPVVGGEAREAGLGKGGQIREHGGAARGGDGDALELAGADVG